MDVERKEDLVSESDSDAPRTLDAEGVRQMIERLRQDKEQYVRQANAEVNRQVGEFDGRIAALEEVLGLLEGKVERAEV
jgi:hypothetical protein